MAIRSGATESDQIVGSNTEKMFTTEVTELTEFDYTRIEQFGPGRRRRGFRECWDRKEWWGKSLIERTKPKWPRCAIN